MGALSSFRNASYGYVNSSGDKRPIYVFISWKQYVTATSGLSFQSKSDGTKTRNVWAGNAAFPKEDKIKKNRIPKYWEYIALLGTLDVFPKEKKNRQT
jgi:hypothetical protein